MDLEDLESIREQVANLNKSSHHEQPLITSPWPSVAETVVNDTPVGISCGMVSRFAGSRLGLRDSLVLDFHRRPIRPLERISGHDFVEAPCRELLPDA